MSTSAWEVALEDCFIFRTILGLFVASVTTTAFLFFLRVRAIFNRHQFIIWFFFMLVLGVFVGALMSALWSPAFAPANYIILMLSPITIAVNDTLIFLAISWRLNGSGRKRSLYKFILGEYLPQFTRHLLQGGLIYYL